MYIDRNGSPILKNCTFNKNATGGLFGGAICNYNSNPEFKNCVFSENTCVEYGGGMYNFIDSNSTLINCTFSGNVRGQGGGGGGMTNNRNSHATLTNCILFGDRPEEIHLMDSTLVVAYSNIQNARPGSWPGTGNLNTDSLFVNYREGDLHLRSRSPCINAGDPKHASEAGETDIDGEARIMGNRIDMGADEFCP